MPKAKFLTNTAKLFIVFMMMLFCIMLTVIGGKPPDNEATTSIIYLAAFIFLVFSPVDLSLMIQNIFPIPIAAKDNSTDILNPLGAKELSNTVKVAAALIAFLINLFYIIYYKKMMTTDGQASLLKLLLFIVLVFSPIDLSLISRNIFQRSLIR